MKSVAILIPTTSNKMGWTNINNSFLVTIFINTFKLIINKNINYKLFIGIDKNDILFDNTRNQTEIMNMLKGICDVSFIYLNAEKGHLSRAWNELFTIAYNELFDYFYQCGDDIDFCNNFNYFNNLIEILEKQNDYGVTGSLCVSRADILTQSFVSRKHMEIFGFYFPEEIKNWYIDDWISYVYKDKYYTPYKSGKIKNSGGNPRYIIEEVNKTDFMSIVEKYKSVLNNKINIDISL
jgi:hypothetical protein